MIEEKRACGENENVELIEDRGFGIIDASAEVLKVRNKMVGGGDKRSWLSIWRLECRQATQIAWISILMPFVDLIEG